MLSVFKEFYNVQKNLFSSRLIVNYTIIVHSRSIKQNLTKSYFNGYYFTVLYLVKIVDMNLFFIASVFFWLHPHPITIINYHFNLSIVFLIKFP